MKIQFLSKDLYHIVTGSNTCPSINDENKCKEWIWKDIKAQELIVLHLDEKITSHIMTCEIANKMWEKLISVYEQRLGVSLHHLWESFLNSPMIKVCLCL